MDLDLNKKGKKFKDYFHVIVNNRVEEFINDLNKKHTTYLFSGILRNYFLSVYEQPRDLDIVISRKTPYTDLIPILDSFGDYKLNAFGGFKINIKGLSIDIWHIEDTWAIKNNIVKLEKGKIEEAVLRSTFFNFSSVLYNFQKEKFIYDYRFEEFLKTKTIDIVLEKNISELLCLINIIYYAEKFELSLSNKVKYYFIEKFKNYNKQNYENIQLIHFKCIKYDYALLNNFYENLKYDFYSGV